MGDKKRLPVDLDVELINQVSAFAVEKDMSRTAAVSHLLRRGLAIEREELVSCHLESFLRRLIAEQMAGIRSDIDFALDAFVDEAAADVRRNVACTNAVLAAVVETGYKSERSKDDFAEACRTAGLLMSFGEDYSQAMGMGYERVNERNEAESDWSPR